MKNKKVVITGAAGFIGSNIAHRLLEENEIIAIDNLSTGNKRNIIDIEGDLDFIEANILNLEMLKNAFSGAEFVLHLGALPSVPRSVKDPVATNEVNITGTLNVLIAARDEGVKRVVFSSSSSVYGDTPTLPKQESMKPNPLSPYAISKITGEYYCKNFYNLYGLETVALRYFNVFGPRQNPESQYAAVIPKFIKSLSSNLQPTVYGDGEQTRDFTYVENVIQANVKACTSNMAPGNVYNIGCGKRYSINTLIALLNELLNKDIEPAYLEPREGDIRDSLADISSAEKDLNYKPNFDFKAGLKETIQWFG